MPGIVGLITKMPRARAERELQAMLATVRHDPAWASGVWIDEAAGLYVGWTARRNSFSERMPARNRRGDVVLIFSGEEYSASGDAGHAREQGSNSLVEQCDTDRAFPVSLNGWFHGVVADRSRDVVTLFNDRYGMHRLYYHESNEAFRFAGEAKAILAVQPQLREINPESLAEFVACGCTLENRTLFPGIKLLPPASAWSFRGAQLEQRTSYFDPAEWEQQEQLNPQQYYGELREVFSATVPRYFTGNERAGVSLTGGLDTRMIMAWHKAAPGTLPCYSFGGMYRDSRDVSVARRVAQACGQPHEVIMAGSEFLSRFAQYAERAVYLTDGCVAVNHAPDLYLNEAAAQIAPVRMTGNYGGEVLRRVRAFKPVDPMPGLFAREFLTHVETAKQTYARVIDVHPLSFSVFRQAPWHHYGLLSLEQTQLSLRSPFLDNDLVKTIYRAPEQALANQDVSLRLIADGNPVLRNIWTDLGAGAAGKAGATARRWLGLTFKAEYAYDLGMPQWLARIDHALGPLHPEKLFLGRHKFTHFRVWYRDVLSRYVQDVLLDQRTLTRGHVEAASVRMMVQEHVAGRRNYTGAIHKLLTLELLHRVFIDSATAVVPQTPEANELAMARVQ
jgi:asparagine synthase (glutamine-hydrolysing)